MIVIPDLTDLLPQNWPTWKKELCFFAIIYNVMMGAILSPILSTVGGPIVEEFRISFPQFALLSGWPLLSTGLTACALSPGIP